MEIRNKIVYTILTASVLFAYVSLRALPAPVMGVGSMRLPAHALEVNGENESFSRGDIQLRRGDLTLALASYKEGLLKSPNQTRYFIKAVELQFVLHGRSAALSLLKQLLWGMAQKQGDGRSAPSLDHLKRALAERFYTVDGQALYVSALEAMQRGGQFKHALGLLRRAVEYEGDHVKVLSALATCTLQAGEYASYVEVLQRLHVAQRNFFR